MSATAPAQRRFRPARLPHQPPPASRSAIGPARHLTDRIRRSARMPTVFRSRRWPPGSGYSARPRAGGTGDHVLHAGGHRNRVGGQAVPHMPNSGRCVPHAYALIGMFTRDLESRPKAATIANSASSIRIQGTPNADSVFPAGDEATVAGRRRTAISARPSVVCLPADSAWRVLAESLPRYTPGHRGRA